MTSLVKEYGATELGKAAVQARTEVGLPAPSGWRGKISGWSLGRLPPVDLASYRIARHWVSLHGDEAETQALKMLETYRAEGDEMGEDIWDGILRAIALIRAVTFRPRRPQWKIAGAKTEG